MGRCFFRGAVLAVYLSLLAIAVPVTAGAAVSTGDGTWVWQNPLPQDNRLLATAFVGASTGWAVGESGTIIHTTDGGDTWVGQASGTNYDLTGLSFPDAQHGWIIGRAHEENEDGNSLGVTRLLLCTTDGGAAWQRQPLPTSPLAYHPTGVCFIDAQHGWVLGQTDGYGSVLLRTVDGGHTWDFQYPDTWQPLTAITFIDSAHGWAVGWRNVYRTSDGGQTWSQAWEDPDGFGTTYYKTVAVSGGNVLVSGTDNGLTPLMVRSDDDGATWHQVASPPEFVAPPSFTSSSEGWGIAVDWSHNGLVHTTDGGITWQTQYGPLFTDSRDYSDLPLSGIAVVDGQHGWAVGALGAILRTADGSAWGNLTTSLTDEDLHGVEFADDLHGWAVGGGRLFRTGDGGQTWARVAAGTDFGFFTLSFIDADEGWAGGAYDWTSQSALMHTSDGGATWSFVPTGDAVATVAILKVQFLDADHGWILLGYDGQMARTTDGGATWQALDTAGMTGASDFTFFDAQHGWLVGQASQEGDGTPIGKTAYTTDGGVTWTPDGAAYSGGYTTATRVAFGDAQNGYAVGQGGCIQRTADGGVTWQQVDLAAQTPPLPFHVTTADYKDVVATDAMHAAAVAGNGVILRTADGGVTWFEQDSGRERQLSPYERVYQPPLLAAIAASDATHLWAVGSHGTILASSRPVAGADETPPTTLLPDADGAWHDGGVVHLVASDGGSGIAETRYKMDDGPWRSGTVVSMGEGTHDVSFFSTDVAGNVEQTHTDQVKIDLTPPVTVASGNDDAWHDQPVIVTLDASDAQCGIAGTWFTLDGTVPLGGDTATVPAPPGGVKDGEWLVTFWSQDAAGNAEEAETVTVKIDTWAPVATSISDGVIAARSSSITLSASDVNADPTITANSGVIAIDYAVDDGAAGAGSATAQLAAPVRTAAGAAATPSLTVAVPVRNLGVADGLHGIVFHGVDAAGNEGAENSIRIRVDTHAPWTIAPSAASVRRGRTVSLKYVIRDAAPNAGWASSTVRIRTLRGKTVGTLPLGRVKVNRALTALWRCTLPRGRYRFFIYAKDAAGNAQSKAGSNVLTVR